MQAIVKIFFYLCPMNIHTDNNIRLLYGFVTPRRNQHELYAQVACLTGKLLGINHTAWFHAYFDIPADIYSVLSVKEPEDLPDEYIASWALLQFTRGHMTPEELESLVLLSFSTFSFPHDLTKFADLIAQT